MTVSLIFGGIAVLYTGLFAFGVWRRAGLRSRAELLTSAADCGFVLVLAHRLIDWGSVPAWAFLLPAALTAAGLAGAVLAWPRLPKWRPDSPVRRARTSAGIQIAVSLGLSALLLVL